MIIKLKVEFDLKISRNEESGRRFVEEETKKENEEKIKRERKK